LGGSLFGEQVAGPPRSEPSTFPLGCSRTTPEDVNGAVRAPFLHPERGLVPQTRALSHYSGEPSWKKADYPNLNRRPARMPVYGAGLRMKPGARPWSL